MILYVVGRDQEMDRGEGMVHAVEVWGGRVLCRHGGGGRGMGIKKPTSRMYRTTVGTTMVGDERTPVSCSATRRKYANRRPVPSPAR